MSDAYSGHTVTLGWDALDRNTTQAGPLGTVSYQYDLSNRRTRMTWPDSLYVVYDYDAANEVTAVRENGATSGAGVLATFAYDDLGRRTGLSRGNGVSTSYSYDGASRLSSVAHDLSGTTNDQTLTYTYNAAGEVLTRTGSNASYTWGGATNVTRSYTLNGLNQVTAAGTASLSYDARGNLTSDGTNTFGYDTLNHLTSGPGSAALAYDPLGRLYQTVGGGVTTKFAYDGMNLISEYNSSGTLLRRYVFGPGMDEPLVWYEGSGTTDRRSLASDNLGSVIAVTNSSGNASTINTYDDYGVPGASNAGRFQHAGQAWVPEVGLYNDKTRAYSPTLGRFLQTDKLGYGGGMNLYGYTGGDPINSRDPYGTDPLRCPTPDDCEADEIRVTASRVLFMWDARIDLSTDLGLASLSSNDDLGLKECHVNARVIAGAPSAIGKVGAYGTDHDGRTIAVGSAAVIRRQFGLDKGQMRAVRDSISGYSPDFRFGFTGVDDEVNNDDPPKGNFGPPPPGYNKTSWALSNRYPGAVIVEINGLPKKMTPDGTVPFIIIVPMAVKCPTSAVSGS